jgi:hypothetical protein
MECTPVAGQLSVPHHAQHVERHRLTNSGDTILRSSRDTILNWPGSASANGNALTAGFDAAGDRTSITYSDGYVVNYGIR